jgi:sodium-coupled neutral amino acid transporter 11
MIIGDCFSRVLAPLGLPYFVSGRNPIIVIATSTILLFLCNLKSLAALARVSIAGTAAALFTLFVVASRFLDGSYAVGGALLSAAPLAPRFDTFSGHPFATLLTPASTKLFCTFAYAFTIHYSAPQFWSQLRPGKDKVKTMTAAAFTAFIGASMFGCLLIFFGFLTFGGACQGNLLNNYAVSDSLALPARAALGLSIINNFPIIFLNFRDSTLRLLGSAAQELDRSRRTLVTVILLLSIAPWAVVLQDLGRLAAVTGAVLSSFLLYTAPAMMALNASRRGIFRLPRRQAMIERALWMMMVPVGIWLAVVGCANSLR